MSKVQYLIENTNESQFYLVEHVINNAIHTFCENVSLVQFDTITKYIDLLSQSKMDLALESELSKEVSPYLEAYVDIYSSFIFQDIKESESEFSLADYRSKVGKDVVLEFFKTVGKLATLGSVIATAAAATWAIKNPEELKSAVDTITEKLGAGEGNNTKIIKYVRNLFGLNDLSTASEQLKQLADQNAAAIKKAIDTNSEDINTTDVKVKEFGKNLKGVISKAGSKIKSWFTSDKSAEELLNKDFG